MILLGKASEGVRWENVLHMEALIAEKKSAGAAMIVVELNLAFAERMLADRYLIMDQGRRHAGRLALRRSRRSDVLAHLRMCSAFAVIARAGAKQSSLYVRLRLLRRSLLAAAHD